MINKFVQNMSGVKLC